jgi:hypothetical protein
MPFAPYQSATRCSGSAPAGSRALMKYLLDTEPGSRNLGIYNCRAVRGGGARSLHSEGRALDLGMPMTNGKGSAAGMALVEALRLVADDLGIQCIIYNRRIWSAKSPGKTGRAYTGVNPHYDHLHIELTRSAGSGLALAKIRAVLGGQSAPKPAEPKPSTGKKLPVLSEGDRHELVPTLKRYLGITDPDTLFGGGLDAKVRNYQRSQGLEVDGVVGPKTWGRILTALKLPGWHA